MALDNTQRAKIRRYLGYPDRFRDSHWDLEAAMDQLTAEAEVEVEEILADLASLQTAYDSARSNLIYKQVEDVHFNTREGMSALRDERSRLVSELANILAVPVLRSGATVGQPTCRS